MGDKKTVEEFETQLYLLIAKLRSSGNRDYHNLTSTYLLANSIFMSATAILLTRSSFLGYSLSFVLSVMGIFLCFQMRIAQMVFLARNTYWESTLRMMENKNKKIGKYDLYNALYKLLKKGIKPEQMEDISKFEYAIKIHQKFWASRMKGLPFIFGTVFIFLLVASIWLIFT